MRDDGASSSLATANARYGVISAPGFLSLVKSPFLSPYAFDTNGNISDYLADADDYLSDVLNKAADLPHLTPESCRNLLPDRWTKE